VGVSDLLRLELNLRIKPRSVSSERSQSRYFCRALNMGEITHPQWKMATQSFSWPFSLGAGMGWQAGMRPH
jgi:hypothetical protein